MDFAIGEKVIHCTYGLGEIIKIEEKTIRGTLTMCYVVRATDMMIWIPINDLQKQSLRTPTEPEEFLRLSSILTKPSELLLEDRALRKDQLIAQLHDGQLESIFRVVRDLTHFKRSTKLNDQEKSILESAINSLLTEWSYSLGVPVTQARLAMTDLLGE